MPDLTVMGNAIRLPCSTAHLTSFLARPSTRRSAATPCSTNVFSESLRLSEELILEAVVRLGGGEGEGGTSIPRGRKLVDPEPNKKTLLEQRVVDLRFFNKKWRS